MKRTEQFGPIRDRLTSFHAQDPEENFSRRMLRLLEDPLKPRNQEGRFRVNPILLLLAALAVVTIGTFLYFSFAAL